jgi:hypothetical protein
MTLHIYFSFFGGVGENMFNFIWHGQLKERMSIFQASGNICQASTSWSGCQNSPIFVTNRNVQLQKNPIQKLQGDKSTLVFNCFFLFIEKVQLCWLQHLVRHIILVCNLYAKSGNTSLDYFK